MYGTIARCRVKPGAEKKFIELARDEQALHIPGLLGQYVYRMDANPNELFLVVIFDSKQAYIANADSPEQDARYRQFHLLLEEDPEWHDGEIVYPEPGL